MSDGVQKAEFQLTLRRRGISDQQVLRAMDHVPRDEFVEPHSRIEAFADTALPIACGQTISQPFVVAYMSEQLRLMPRHRVLEIGTGSGYQAAVLSQLADEVVTFERFRTLGLRAAERLKRLGCRNVRVEIGDGLNPGTQFGDFDRIIVTASVEEIPSTLTDILKPDGILIAPVGLQHAAQMLVRVTKKGEALSRENLIAVRFVPALPGVAKEF
jgi:protein-L-isoaspartate(D-aspartate) O-methyltransferase